MKDPKRLMVLGQEVAGHRRGACPRLDPACEEDLPLVPAVIVLLPRLEAVGGAIGKHKVSVAPGGV